MFVVVAGCATEPYFPETVADVLCTRLEACDEDAFALDWTSQPQCRASVRGSMAFYDAEAEGRRCDFDPAIARACLDDVRRSACDEIVAADVLAACGAAWGCPPAAE